MLIYRFEDEKGRGCFGNNGVRYYNDNTKLGDCCYDPPGPLSEGRGTALHTHCRNNSLEGWRFGFASKASLKRWFRCAKGRRAMGKNGNRLVIYEVPSAYVLRGDWQVIFRYSAAVKVGELDLGTLKHLS